VPAGATPPDEPYRESSAFEWTEVAFEMLERGELLGEVIANGGVVRSRVQGPCPRCRHALDDQQVHTAVTGYFADGLRGLGSGAPGAAVGDEARYYQVDVSCGCGDDHSGAPEGKAGCGVSFRVELPLQPGRSSSQR